MIVHIVTANVNPGKAPQMMAWSQKAVAFVKENHDHDMSVLTNVAGAGNEFHFMTTHDSLASLETYTNGVNADEQFHALVAEAAQQELWSATRTSIHRSAF